MNLTVGQYRFKVNTVVKATQDAYSVGSFNSWTAVVRLLAKRGFNQWEAEALLFSKHMRWASDSRKGQAQATSADVARYLDSNNITHRCKEVNTLIMSTFGKEHKLELNGDGIPCKRGTMPGNYDPKKTILVALGTPSSCDPTTEQYWSM